MAQLIPKFFLCGYVQLSRLSCSGYTVFISTDRRMDMKGQRPQRSPLMGGGPTPGSAGGGPMSPPQNAMQQNPGQAPPPGGAMAQRAQYVSALQHPGSNSAPNKMNGTQPNAAPQTPKGPMGQGIPK